VLAELVRRCTAAGFRQMVAVIGHPGNPASLALHQGLGFTHAGEFKAIGYKFGRWIDAIMLQRSLGEGSSTAPED
jgi:phosphinothricin acetyltransferase